MYSGSPVNPPRRPLGGGAFIVARRGTVYVTPATHTPVCVCGGGGGSTARPSVGQPQTYADPHRFEKISNIIKQFKLSCSKSQAQFEKMEVQNSRFTAFIDVFTSNTYLMAILSPSTGAVEPAVPLLNIALARQHFEQIVAPTARANQPVDSAVTSSS